MHFYRSVPKVHVSRWEWNILVYTYIYTHGSSFLIFFMNTEILILCICDEHTIHAGMKIVKYYPR